MCWAQPLLDKTSEVDGEMVDIDDGRLQCGEQSPDAPKVFRSLAIALCW